VTIKGDSSLAVMQHQGEDLILSHLTEDQREATRRLVARNARARENYTREQDEMDLLWVLGLIKFEEEEA
jgi:calcineurin-like phosphoesterase family protein